MGSCLTGARPPPPPAECLTVGSRLPGGCGEIRRRGDKKRVEKKKMAGRGRRAVPQPAAPTSHSPWDQARHCCRAPVALTAGHGLLRGDTRCAVLQTSIEEARGAGRLIASTTGSTLQGVGNLFEVIGE